MDFLSRQKDRYRTAQLIMMAKSLVAAFPQVTHLGYSVAACARSGMHCKHGPT